METREIGPNFNSSMQDNNPASRKEGKKKKKLIKQKLKFDEQRLMNPATGLKKLYFETKDFVPSGNAVFFLA